MILIILSLAVLRAWVEKDAEINVIIVVSAVVTALLSRPQNPFQVESISESFPWDFGEDQFVVVVT